MSDGSPASAEAGDAAPELRAFLHFVLWRPGFAMGYAIVLATALVGLLAPWLPLHPPREADPSAFLLPPSLVHPMGTDATGLDVFSRVLHAPRVDLAIALVSTAWGALVGGALGACAGMWHGRRGAKGWTAAAILRTGDVAQAFPVFALALVLVAVLGQGVASVVIAIGAVNVPVYLRLMRAETLALRSRNYVEAAAIAGAGDFYLLARHIAPHATAPLLAQATINTGAAVLLTAGLSFLGAGVRAPTPEWGSMIAMGFQNIVTGQWWPSIFPGLALALTVFGLGRIGASIQAWSDPRERVRPTRRQWNAFVRDRTAGAD
ncbi:ABC transporter permease [Niveibacterium sp. SC-1]|uniref:ABC transporter permease n=1 Tax=Niveibacterium sp. SC-1 TaxID=3135646 RepID=UPI00311D89C7